MSLGDTSAFRLDGWLDGGQTLNIGLRNLDKFAWIGAFSSAPNTKPAAVLMPQPAEVAKQLKLLHLQVLQGSSPRSIMQEIRNSLFQNAR
jgi:hypothetical protein